MTLTDWLMIAGGLYGLYFLYLGLRAAFGDRLGMRAKPAPPDSAEREIAVRVMNER